MNKVNYAWMYLLLLNFTGCSMFATAPIDTFNKQVAAFEISYGVLLDKANLYKKEGRFTPEAKLKMDEAIKTTELTLNAVHAAMVIGDITSAGTQLGMASKALELIRAGLVEAEDK